MWVLKVEVWPYGDHSHPEETLKLAACNDGTCNPATGRGNYKVIDATGVPDEQCRRLLIDAMDSNSQDLYCVLGWPRESATEIRKQGHLEGLVNAVLTARAVGEHTIIHAE